ncbi:MAG: hypothetical protein U1E64_00100 [Sphingomonadaceae bacterium]
MNRRATLLTSLAGAVCAIALAGAPAVGASANNFLSKRLTNPAPRVGIGSYTPVAADPVLAAALARSGFNSTGFRFTPAAVSNRNRAVTVAVRARTGVLPSEADRVAAGTPATLGIAPVAYSLGVGVGWKRFALSGDVTRVDSGALPGGREAADVAVSYNARKWSTRLQVAADRPTGNAPRTISGNESVSLDVGGAYRLTRNLDVTAGVRYRSERNRLEPLTDNRRDSQAIYVGTAFRF